MRWFRGRLYVTARNKSGIASRHGLRCLLLLPWTAFLPAESLQPIAATTA